MSSFELPPAKKQKTEEGRPQPSHSVVEVGNFNSGENVEKEYVTHGYNNNNNSSSSSSTGCKKIMRRNSSFAGGRIRKRNSMCETPRPLQPIGALEGGAEESPRPSLPIRHLSHSGADHDSFASAVNLSGEGTGSVSAGQSQMSIANDGESKDLNGLSTANGVGPDVLTQEGVFASGANTAVTSSEEPHAQQTDATGPSKSNIPSGHGHGFEDNHGCRQAYDPNKQMPQAIDNYDNSRITVPPKPMLQGWCLPSRYIPIEEIGRGSYGSVCRAHDTFMNNQEVAIKKIADVFCNVGDARRILREIKILRNLRHDNIIPILDIITPADRVNFKDLYIVFTKMDCDMLRIIDDTSQQLQDAHIISFMRQMLKALMYMHNSQVIHRDIKPGNILLTEDCSLRICDFGLARGFDEVEELKSVNSPQRKATRPKLMRQMTQHVATRWYRAPELILRRRYTPAIDVWSVGCIFGELLAMKESTQYPRLALFPGQFCQLSPTHTNMNMGQDYKNSQLDVIYSIIGTPSREVFKNMGVKDSAIDGLTRRRRDPIDFRQRYPSATPESLDLLEKMLKFDPEARIGISDALSHKYLSDDTTGRASASASGQTHTELGVSIDFSFEGKATTKKRIREMILEECDWYANVWRKEIQKRQEDDASY